MLREALLNVRHSQEQPATVQWNRSRPKMSLTMAGFAELQRHTAPQFWLACKTSEVVEQDLLSSCAQTAWYAGVIGFSGCSQMLPMCLSLKLQSINAQTYVHPMTYTQQFKRPKALQPKATVHNRMIRTGRTTEPWGWHCAYAHCRQSGHAAAGLHHRYLYENPLLCEPLISPSAIKPCKPNNA